MQAWTVVGYTYKGEAWCAGCQDNLPDYHPVFASDDMGDIVCHTCGQGLGED